MVASVPNRIAIVGAGYVGQSWGIVFARAGWSVALHDVAEARIDGAVAAVRQAAAEAGQPGVVEGFADVADAVAGAGYVQESAAEILPVKQALFAEIGRAAGGDTILASSSSALTASEIFGGLATRGRCIIAHPANPPHLLKTVEVVPAPFTDADVVRRTIDLLAGVGQIPVAVGEVAGFVMNRLQAALAAEALSLVERGIASGEAIDSIVRNSLGVRWSFMGPFETMDLNAPGGFADYAARYGKAFAGLVGRDAWPAGAVARVDAERRHLLPLAALDARRDWRDAELEALRDHFAGIGRPQQD